MEHQWTQCCIEWNVITGLDAIKWRINKLKAVLNGISTEFNVIEWDISEFNVILKEICTNMNQNAPYNLLLLQRMTSTLCYLIEVCLPGIEFT